MPAFLPDWPKGCSAFCSARHCQPFAFRASLIKLQCKIFFCALLILGDWPVFSGFFIDGFGLNTYSPSKS
jgi:hypothetical protein